MDTLPRGCCSGESIGLSPATTFVKGATLRRRNGRRPLARELLRSTTSGPGRDGPEPLYSKDTTGPIQPADQERAQGMLSELPDEKKERDSGPSQALTPIEPTPGYVLPQTASEEERPAD